MESSAQLKQLRVDLIDPNPENPRTIFRPEEMDNLLISVKKYGVQVPISVYQEGSRYVLIDGERRWRTSKKLNLLTIPAIIQSKPSVLNNLLMMFNIHALREQWDLFTISNKITRVIELLTEKFGIEPNEIQLSEETGLNRGTIRRCRLLIELPERFKKIILIELEKPKSKQKLTEDFFIEMEAALKTVKRNAPGLLNGNIDEVRDNLIGKYKQGLIKSRIDFRMIGKLATSPKNVEFPEEDAANALNQIFYSLDSGIEDIFNTTVGVLYDEKKLISNFSNVLRYIRNLTEEERSDEDIRQSLKDLQIAIEEILER
ncbi:MAG TPA: ParB/RepB/Spo0J family partition protein [Pyrinomonadaceae bacterium]|jgi:ParB/RepB/Spo0J family partition protein|nr:ParB/RepB/Spo0J family partition protein [Pyrinomonadaceae bacterium]